MKSSELYGCPIIDESNAVEMLELDTPQPGHGRGRLPRDFSKVPHGSLPFAAKMTSKPFPRSEWKERILDLQKQGIVVSQIARKAGVKTKNQGSTNYCWINAPVLCLEICRVLAGEPYLSLSPASGGAIVNQFQNRGGWGTEAVKFMVSTGLVPTRFWPDNAIDRRYDTAETRAMRSAHRVTEWLDLKPRSFDEMMTQLILGRPVAIGLDYWGHEIVACDPIVLADGRFASRIWNSWSDNWGQQGMAILVESKCTPDDAVCPLLATALPDRVIVSGSILVA